MAESEDLQQLITDVAASSKAKVWRCIGRLGRVYPKGDGAEVEVEAGVFGSMPLIKSAWPQRVAAAATRMLSQAQCLRVGNITPAAGRRQDPHPNPAGPAAQALNVIRYRMPTGSLGQDQPLQSSAVTCGDL